MDGIIRPKHEEARGTLHSYTSINYSFITTSRVLVNGEGSSPSRQFLYIRWEWHYEEKELL